MDLTVQDKHDGSEVESPLLVPEDHLAKITDIANFRVSKTELPKAVLDIAIWAHFLKHSPGNQGRIQDQGSYDYSQDQSRNKTKDGI